MKTKIYVTLKPSVLDPQGKAIHHSLETMGFTGIEEVRQGKYFEVTFNSLVTREAAGKEIERIAGEVLSNPVIEDFKVEFD